MKMSSRVSFPVPMPYNVLVRLLIKVQFLNLRNFFRDYKLFDYLLLFLCNFEMASFHRQATVLLFLNALLIPTFSIFLEKNSGKSCIDTKDYFAVSEEMMIMMTSCMRRI